DDLGDFRLVEAGAVEEGGGSHAGDPKSDVRTGNISAWTLRREGRFRPKIGRVVRPARAPGWRRTTVTHRSIIAAVPRVSRSRCGGRRAGSIRLIRAAGSSGIVATPWDGACRTRIGARLDAGRRFDGTCGK